MITTAEGVAFEVGSAHPDAHFRLLVAHTGEGLVIGTAQLGIAYDSPEPGRSYVNAYVDPAHRGLGAGSLLLRTAEEHLAARGAVDTYAWVLDEPAHRAFAGRRGYRPSRSAHFLRLDLAAAALPRSRRPFRPGSSCGPPPPSPPTRVRSSRPTRRRRTTNRAIWPPTSTTTRTGSRTPGTARPSTRT